MGTEIYYFSGTGNSLAVARDIANKINGKLIPIPAIINNESINIDADSFGIVFPVYHQSFPFIIKRFIEKVNGLAGKYIFAVCTHGGGPGISLEYLGKKIELKGGKLAAGFAVEMPYNYITPALNFKDFYNSFTLRESNKDKQQKMFIAWERKQEYICRVIDTKSNCKPEVSSKVIEYLVDGLNLRENLQKRTWLKIAGVEDDTERTFIESLQLMDNGFHADEKCNSCGICAKICPVRNIGIVDGRPVWKHHCEQCFACLQWCPKESVQFGKNTAKGKRYHHPGVKLSDMILYDEAGKNEQ